MMLFLAAWPVLQWAKNTRLWFPVFEIYMITGIAFYAIPYIWEHETLVNFSNKILLQTAMTIIAFQVSAIFAFNTTRSRPTRKRDWIRPLLQDSAQKLSGLGIWLNTSYLFVSMFTEVIPYQIGNILRAVFFGIGIISIFIQARLWGQNNLSGSGKAVLVLNIVIQSILLASQLYLINVISILALALIAYTTTSRKIPLIPLIVLLPILAILHSGKSDMREIYWQPDFKRAPELSELYGFYESWFTAGLSPASTDINSGEAGTSLLQRASLFQIIAVTVSEVPDKLPFLMGETYADIPALIVPRFLWPSKPTALESNKRLSLYFGLVSDYSAESVSIAFGMLAESYANFGIIGSIAFGLLLGTLFKRICVAAEGAPFYSPIGLFVILLTAWSLQVEMVAATWVSSLFQATMVMVLLPMFMMRFLGR